MIACDICSKKSNNELVINYTIKISNKSYVSKIICDLNICEKCTNEFCYYINMKNTKSKIIDLIKNSIEVD